MRDTFNVPYDLFPPAFNKAFDYVWLLWAPGRHSSSIKCSLGTEEPSSWHIPLSLSNPPIAPPPRPFSSSSSTRFESSCTQQLRRTASCPLIPAPKQHYSWSVISHWDFQSKLYVSKVQDTNGSFHCLPAVPHPAPPPPPPFPSEGPPLWLHCRGFCSPSSCLEMRTRHGPLRAFTRYCYVSEPIN